MPCQVVQMTYELAGSETPAIQFRILQSIYDPVVHEHGGPAQALGRAAQGTESKTFPGTLLPRQRFHDTSYAKGWLKHRSGLRVVKGAAKAVDHIGVSRPAAPI